MNSKLRSIEGLVLLVLAGQARQEGDAIWAIIFTTMGFALLACNILQPVWNRLRARIAQ